MAGREVREYTNLTDPKDKKWGKGKDKTDDEDIAFQRMVAKMQEVAGERGGYLHGRGALDSDDLLYLKEQMEAEEDAERLLRRTEKRAFAAFKKAASLADSSPSSVPLPLRVEPKPKSGIRQQDLLKNIVEIRPKRHRISSPSSDASPGKQASLSQASQVSGNGKADHRSDEQVSTSPGKVVDTGNKPEEAVRSLLGLAYESSDED
ncbi:uncharacterized protein LOC18438385 isoform X1 [Amborella trichopoda]|uniref:uncharacterized protein LOC18438385 isoform X1 n=2 Tax=Amborella trichopoda TaxID=13333 RepID=UPI0005D3A81E|nr:uncharacterized protein LOC18438385 isoform X1 [Amborella trichopoda]|eukprot:XP_011625028.1 uncharacterized protein LOC18438385 isoform X1 [Amborella trichopoda]